MGNIEEEIKENYDKNLKAADYITMQQIVAKDYSVMHRFPLTFLYKVLLSGKFKGSKLLEIGSGAVVHYIALASAYYPNIIMSDYVEDNCEELKRWLQGQSPLKQCLDIPAEIEGFGEDLETGKQLLEDRIRKNVKQVVRCDVLKDNIFLEEVKSEVKPPYDLIISSLCLESSVPDIEGLVLALQRINKILRSEGGLFLVGFFKGKHWPSGQSLFHYLEVSKEDLNEALKKGGFGNIDMNIHEHMGIHKQIDFEYENEGYYCLIAEKIKNM